MRALMKDNFSHWAFVCLIFSLHRSKLTENNTYVDLNFKWKWNDLSKDLPKPQRHSFNLQCTMFVTNTVSMLMTPDTILLLAVPILHLLQFFQNKIEIERTLLYCEKSKRDLSGSAGLWQVDWPCHLQC